MGHPVLADVWAALIGLMLALYVILDGFDLGTGVLSLFTPGRDARRAMMAAIGGVWDANETWLVLAGAALFGAFPIAYSILLNALYIPIMLMLFGLIFRAVSFEFHAHGEKKRIWEIAFGIGSLVATAGQGLTLGGVISGIEAGPQGFEGGVWDWLNPVSVLVMIAATFGYTMIGASYLIAKTEGEGRRLIQGRMAVSSVLMLLLIAATSILMVLERIGMTHGWLGSRYTIPALGIGALFAFVMLLLGTRYRGYRRIPFVASLLAFAAAFAGLVVGLYPYLVPPSITILDAAAPDEILVFMIFGIGFLIPALLFCNYYMYRVFRGPVDDTKTEY